MKSNRVLSHTEASIICAALKFAIDTRSECAHVSDRDNYPNIAEQFRLQRRQASDLLELLDNGGVLHIDEENA